MLVLLKHLLSLYMMLFAIMPAKPFIAGTSPSISATPGIFTTTGTIQSVTTMSDGYWVLLTDGSDTIGLEVSSTPSSAVNTFATMTSTGQWFNPQVPLSVIQPE